MPQAGVIDTYAVTDYIHTIGLQVYSIENIKYTINMHNNENIICGHTIKHIIIYTMAADTFPQILRMPITSN